jgi:hypothetical protein
MTWGPYQKIPEIYNLNVSTGSRQPRRNSMHLSSFVTMLHVASKLSTQPILSQNLLEEPALGFSMACEE